MASFFGHKILSYVYTVTIVIFKYFLKSYCVHIEKWKHCNYTRCLEIFITVEQKPYSINTLGLSDFENVGEGHEQKRKQIYGSDSLVRSLESFK